MTLGTGENVARNVVEETKFARVLVPIPLQSTVARAALDLTEKVRPVMKTLAKVK